MFIRICISYRFHIRYDNRPVQRQKFTPPREALYGKILEHVFLVLYTFRTPFICKQSDFQIPVRFHNGSSGRTIKLRCALQQAIDDIFRILQAAQPFFQEPKCCLEIVRRCAVVVLCTVHDCAPFCKSKNCLIVQSSSLFRSIYHWWCCAIICP